jgi:hypothetical protein
VGALKVMACLLDGEAIVCGASGLASFAALRSRQHDGEATLCASLDGEDLRSLPLAGRKQLADPAPASAPAGLVDNEHWFSPDLERAWLQGFAPGIRSSTGYDPLRVDL